MLFANIKPVWPLGGLVLIGVSLAGCDRGLNKPPPPGPVEVKYLAAVEDKITDYEDFTGRLEAVKKVEVQARVTGYLQKVNFVEGGQVKAGQVLFEIDPLPYQSELDKAEASVVQTKARLKRLEGDLLRAQELYRTKSMSREDYEKIVGDHAEASAAVGVAQASRTSAKIFVDYTKVTSPITGMVSRANLETGNLVKADSTILTTVVTEDPMYAYFDVDERTLLALRRLVGAGVIEAADKTQVPVHMALADEDNFPHAGTVDFQDNTIDSNTGTLRLRGVFPNRQGLLAPGMFVRVQFQVGLPRLATLVPEQGVGTDQGQKYVYVVNAANVVEYRKIKTGMLVNKAWRVVEKSSKSGEGVRVGERIIVSGLQRVRPRVQVDPIPDDSPAIPTREPPRAILNVKDLGPQ